MAAHMRWPMKLWNAVFLDVKAYADKPGKDAAWNRGVYLVQRLGHCGSSQAARRWFPGETTRREGAAFLSGGAIENWFASNLTSEHNPGLGRWSEADLVQLIKTGANRHAKAFGSMTDVVNYSTHWLAHPVLKAIARHMNNPNFSAFIYPGKTPGSAGGLSEFDVSGSRLYPMFRGKALHGTHCRSIPAAFPRWRKGPFEGPAIESHRLCRWIVTSKFAGGER